MLFIRQVSFVSSISSYHEASNLVTSSNRDSSANTIVVYGSTGLVGKAVCVEAQRNGCQVIGLSRTRSKACSESIEIDFLDYEHLAKTAQELIGRENIPDAFVFCHRSRISSHLSEADALLQSIAIDIYPYLALKDALKKIDRKGSLNIVTVTSNAAFRFAQDVNYMYHITKHAQVAASFGLSSAPTSLDVYSNVVSFGEVIDNSKQDHDLFHRQLFPILSRCSSDRPVPSIENVAKVAVMLCKASSFGFCGQTLVIDSGLSNITQESVVRLLTSCP